MDLRDSQPLSHNKLCWTRQREIEGSSKQIRHYKNEQEIGAASQGVEEGEQVEKNPDEIEGEIEVEAREVVGGASRRIVQAGLQHIPSQGKNEADHQAQENWS